MCGEGQGDPAPTAPLHQIMVEDRFVELRGLMFHYRDWGGRGAPLVLLHGLASTSHIFDLVAPRLAKNLRVVALDQRGHGESAKPDDGYDFETIVSDLLAFMDSLQFERAMIAGHSWGGNVALQFAAEHPARAAALVLIDGGFLDIQADPEMTWERTAKQLAPPNLLGTPVEAFRQRIKGFVGAMWSPLVEQAILANFEILPDETIRPRLSYDRHLKILRALWEQRPPQLYPHVHCPVLLLPAVPEQADEAMAKYLARKRANVALAEQQLPARETVWFNDTVHDVPLQRPQELAAVITQFAQL
jgi:non-heme chloroperoxidase